jgi:hypothetical protein
MGLWPTHSDASQSLVTPAPAGVHRLNELDSRLRGNDAAFDGRQRETSVIVYG